MRNDFTKAVQAQRLPSQQSFEKDWREDSGFLQEASNSLNDYIQTSIQKGDDFQMIFAFLGIHAFYHPRITQVTFYLGLRIS